MVNDIRQRQKYYTARRCVMKARVLETNAVRQFARDSLSVVLFKSVANQKPQTDFC
jgi:hypothetical protein